MKTEWTEIGRAEDIPRQGARVVKTDKGDIAVFRTAEDEIYAIRNCCPHKGGPLSEGIVYGATVACPLHNLSLDLKSGQAVAPDDGCVTTYPVRLEGGLIYLDFSSREPAA